MIYQQIYSSEGRTEIGRPRLREENKRLKRLFFKVSYNETIVIQYNAKRGGPPQSPMFSVTK